MDESSDYEYHLEQSRHYDGLSRQKYEETETLRQRAKELRQDYPGQDWALKIARDCEYDARIAASLAEDYHKKALEHAREAGKAKRS